MQSVRAPVLDHRVRLPGQRDKVEREGRLLHGNLPLPHPHHPPRQGALPRRCRRRTQVSSLNV